MPISDYSTTPANNSAAPPNGFPEGMAPSGVNNSARQVMADIRSWYEDAQWIDFGYDPTYATTSSFTVGGDRTAIFTTGRRVKINDSSTLYGVVASSSFSSPNTTVNVTLDSGSLTIAISAVAVGIITPTNGALPSVGAQNNYAATTNPTVTDDSGDGYSVGSRWVNTSTDTLYECLDATAGAAIWRPSDEIKAGGSAGVVIKNSGGTTVATIGPTNSTNITFAGAVNAGSINSLTTPLAVANGGTGGLFGGKNLLINSQFLYNQRSASSVADDVYGFDRWYALTQTAALTVSAQTNQENSQPTNIRLTQPQVTAQRIGHAQIVQSLNCRHLRGGNAVLSGRIRCSVSQPIRFAILSWTGTADSVTSDVVNNWTSATFTTGNFFNSTTLEVVATGAVTPSVNTWTDLSVTGAVSANMNNLIVMAWTEGTLVQNGTLDLGLVQLESGTTKSAFEYVPSDEELLRCQYYLPVIVGSTSTHMLAICQAYNTSTVVASVQFPTNVRNRPTGVTASALSDFGVWNSAGAVADASAITFVSASFNNAYLEISRTSSGLTAGDASGFVSQNSNASLIFTGCEL